MNQTFVRNYILSRCVILLYQVESESLTPAWYVLVARSPGRPSQNLSSIYRLFVSRTQNGTQTKRKIVFPLAALFVSWWISQQLIRHFLPYLWLPPVRKLRFVVYVCTQRLTQAILFRKVEYPYFLSQIRFGPRKGTGEGGDPWFSHEMSGLRFCGSGAHGIMERTDSACE